MTFNCVCRVSDRVKISIPPSRNKIKKKFLLKIKNE